MILEKFSMTPCTEIQTYDICLFLTYKDWINSIKFSQINENSRWRMTIWSESEIGKKPDWFESCFIHKDFDDFDLV